jgi:selenocysteine-specific elongation factor
MINIIVGTAGHIDHGKTALTGALTGIDTDRLAEEKRRGISIDLGFAWLDLPGEVRLGFVDVPGHERFVRNMLAGAAGIDMVLLVIAADESIKPQTREHFDICRLLGVSAGLVVITKADLVEPDLVDLVRLEAEEFVAGSFLEGAPVIAVSARTGEGIEELKAALGALARRATTKSAEGLLRLPIDRSFVMKGFGTVVTGTLASGAIHVDQEVEAAGLRCRVRGLQVHGSPVSRAVAGQRTAVNLAGAESHQIARGMTLTEAGVLVPRTYIDCELDLLAAAKPLKNRAPVHFHAGTSETIGELRLIEEGPAIHPGSRSLARIHLHDPLLLLPEDRFIIRKFSPVATIGGGRVIDVEPPRTRRALALERARFLAAATPAQRVARLVRDAGPGMDVAALVAATGYTAAAIEEIARSGDFVYMAEPARWIADRGWCSRMAQRIHEVVAAYHQAYPLQPGIPKEQVRTGDLGGPPEFLFEALLRQAKGVAADGEVLRLAAHRLQLQEDEETALGKIENAFGAAGWKVPSVGEVLAGCGVDASRARNLLQILLRQKRLVRVSADLVYHPEAVAGLKRLMAAHAGERFAVPQFKDWTGISRKYAIPLLEFLDRERVTRREGDMRVVL